MMKESTSPNLPREIILRILTFLVPYHELCVFTINFESDQFRTLAPCLRVNKEWFEMTAEIMYSSLRYRSPTSRTYNKIKSLHPFDLGTLNQLPERYLGYIKTVKWEGNIQDIKSIIFDRSDAISPLQHLILSDPPVTDHRWQPNFWTNWSDGVDCQKLSLVGTPMSYNGKPVHPYYHYPPPFPSMTECFIRHIANPHLKISESSVSMALFYDGYRDMYTPEFARMTILFGANHPDRTLEVYQQGDVKGLTRLFAKAIIRSPSQVDWNFVNTGQMECLDDKSLSHGGFARTLLLELEAQIRPLTSVTRSDGSKAISEDSERVVAEERLRRTLGRIKFTTLPDWVDSGGWRGIYTPEQAQPMLQRPMITRDENGQLVTYQ